MNSLGHFSLEKWGVEPTGEEERPMSTSPEYEFRKAGHMVPGKSKAQLQGDREELGGSQRVGRVVKSDCDE